MIYIFIILYIIILLFLYLKLENLLIPMDYHSEKFDDDEKKFDDAKERVLESIRKNQPPIKRQQESDYKETCLSKNVHRLSDSIDSLAETALHNTAVAGAIDKYARRGAFLVSEDNQSDKSKQRHAPDITLDEASEASAQCWNPKFLNGESEPEAALSECLSSLASRTRWDTNKASPEKGYRELAGAFSRTHAKWLEQDYGSRKSWVAASQWRQPNPIMKQPRETPLALSPGTIESSEDEELIGESVWAQKISQWNIVKGAAKGIPIAFDISIEERMNPSVSANKMIPGQKYDMLRGIPNTGNTCAFACAAAIIAHFPKEISERAMNILDRIVATSVNSSGAFSPRGLFAATLCTAVQWLSKGTLPVEIMRSPEEMRRGWQPTALELAATVCNQIPPGNDKGGNKAQATTDLFASVDTPNGNAAYILKEMLFNESPDNLGACFYLPDVTTEALSMKLPDVTSAAYIKGSLILFCHAPGYSPFDISKGKKWDIKMMKNKAEDSTGALFPNSIKAKEGRCGAQLIAIIGNPGGNHWVAYSGVFSAGSKYGSPSWWIKNDDRNSSRLDNLNSMISLRAEAAVYILT